MFSLPTAIHIYLCTTPVDMRCGFDGLAALVRNTLHMDPLSGSLYLFLGQKRDRIKILFWDHDGYALYSKRLERGRFPSLSPSHSSSATPVYHIAAYELTLLLEGIDLAHSQKRKRFQLPNPSLES